MLICGIGGMYCCSKPVWGRLLSRLYMHTGRLGIWTLLGTSANAQAAYLGSGWDYWSIQRCNPVHIVAQSQNALPRVPERFTACPESIIRFRLQFTCLTNDANAS